MRDGLPIQTKRLTLRRFETSDRDRFVAYRSEPPFRRKVNAPAPELSQFTSYENVALCLAAAG